MFVCKVDEGGKFAEQLDLEASIIGNESYFLDEGADGFGGFGPVAFLVEHIGQREVGLLIGFGIVLLVKLDRIAATDMNNPINRR